MKTKHSPTVVTLSPTFISSPIFLKYKTMLAVSDSWPKGLLSTSTSHWAWFYCGHGRHDGLPNLMVTSQFQTRLISLQRHRLLLPWNSLLPCLNYTTLLWFSYYLPLFCDSCPIFSFRQTLKNLNCWAKWKEVFWSTSLNCSPKRWTKFWFPLAMLVC